MEAVVAVWHRPTGWCPDSRGVRCEGQRL